MYDFANTIYSAIVVTAFFPMYLGDLTGRDIYTAIASTTSLVLAGLVVPVAGAIADRTGRALTYLWWLTVVCCLATIAIALPGYDRFYHAESHVAAPASVLIPALVLFGLANFTYQISLVFYNTLLPVVASPERQGRVSGLGVGLGYLGVVVALPIAYLAAGETGAERFAFIIAGVAFLVSSLPTFLFVRPPRPARAERVTLRVLASLYPELGRTLSDIWHVRPVLFFFLGNFLCVDVVNTLIVWTVRYLNKGLGFSKGQSISVMLGLSVTAFLLGMGMGWLTDKLGSRRTILLAAGSILICIASAGILRQRAVIVGVILIFGSGGLGGVWVAGRKWLLEIAPPGKVGKYFGLYGVTLKLSVFGSLLFAGLADWVGYRIALLSLLLPLVAGMALLAGAHPERAESVERETS